MKKSLILSGMLGILLTACSSTDNADSQSVTNAPPAMPESYQTMVDFGIISKNDAMQVVNGQRKALSNNFYRFKESALGQVTDGGDMFLGFAIAQLFGGGVALTDFFNPLALFRGNRYENHLKKTFFWVEVEEDCDRECGYKKVYDIVSLAAKEHTKNLVLLSENGVVEHDWKMNKELESPIREFEAYGTKKSFFGETLSKSYANDLLIMPEGYEPYSVERSFFSLWDADFIYVNGKRYFGSKVTTKEFFTATLHRMGNYYRWDYDNSQTLGFAKASETYPNFVLIETQICYAQRDISYRNTNESVEACQGDLVIADGKVTYTHLLARSSARNLQKSNMINAKIHDARTEIFTEQEWKALFEKNDGEEAVSNRL
ncbi:hypothetical protein GTQ48_06575 [Alteromonas genovensis]|uniref:Lipoprotein n=1 Tax=Alteromonas genovensis TaxID=471225 RepID=A0A6N9TFC2_9ALTE|nr:hypothetical protein [Alteromonas genovensis]NDW15182.1 hypothetical protein [Alteromonas genovensis]